MAFGSNLAAAIVAEPTNEELKSLAGVIRQTIVPSVVINKDGDILFRAPFTDKFMTDKNRRGKFIILPLPTDHVILFQDSGERYDGTGRKAEMFSGNIVEAASHGIKCGKRTVTLANGKQVKDVRRWTLTSTD